MVGSVREKLHFTPILVILVRSILCSRIGRVLIADELVDHRAVLALKVVLNFLLGSRLLLVFIHPQVF